LPSAATWRILGGVWTRRVGCLAFAVALMLAAGPVAAQATTRYVSTGGTDAGACDNPAAPCLTINFALGPAVDDDTIAIGPGTFHESVSTNERLDFVGTGAGTLDAPAGTIVQGVAQAFSLQNGGSLRSLRAIGSDGSAEGHVAVALNPAGAGTFNYTVTDVVGVGGRGTGVADSAGSGLVVNGPVASTVVNASVSGGGFQGGAADNGADGAAASVAGSAVHADLTGVTLRAIGAHGARGLEVLGDAGATLSEGSVSAETAANVNNGTLDVRRSRLESVRNSGVAPIAGLMVADTAASKSSSATVSDSLITATAAVPAPSSGSRGVLVDAFPGGQAASVSLRGTTVVARGAGPDAAVEADREGVPAASIDLRNSVAKLEGGGGASEADLVANKGTITASHSSFNTRVEENGGSAAGPGSGDNVAGDPLLAPDFSLPPGSPLVDRGDPLLVAAGELDLVGNSRSLDGNGDCVAVPDIGAIERPALACPPLNFAPALTGASMTNKVFAPVKPGGKITASRKRRAKRGTRFRYRLSEAAQVRITIERALAGRRKGKGCVKPTKHNRRAKRCKRYKKVTSLKASKQAGRRSTSFTGRVRRRGLKRGRYRARLVAIDSLGARSRERRLAFRVVRP
jgi:hypothetical protein